MDFMTDLEAFVLIAICFTVVAVIFILGMIFEA